MDNLIQLWGSSGLAQMTPGQALMIVIGFGLLFLFNSQDFAALKTVEGKEALRAAALKTVNEALGTTPPDVVEELYFENFVLQ